MAAEIIQVGVKALRKPNGDFMAAMPIYIPMTPELAAREEAIIASIEEVEAFYLAAYIEARKSVEIYQNIY